MQPKSAQTYAPGYAQGMYVYAYIWIYMYVYVCICMYMYVYVCIALLVLEFRIQMHRQESAWKSLMMGWAPMCLHMTIASLLKKLAGAKRLSLHSPGWFHTSPSGWWSHNGACVQPSTPSQTHMRTTKEDISRNASYKKQFVACIPT
jgi:hypothetical protein